MITADLILTQALDGTDQSCMAQIGRPRHVVIQHALRLSDQPDVAREHPQLVARVIERVERQREARRWP